MSHNNAAIILRTLLRKEFGHLGDEWNLPIHYFAFYAEMKNYSEESTIDEAIKYIAMLRTLSKTINPSNED